MTTLKFEFNCQLFMVTLEVFFVCHCIGMFENFEIRCCSYISSLIFVFVYIVAKQRKSKWKWSENTSLRIGFTSTARDAQVSAFDVEEDGACVVNTGHIILTVIVIVVVILKCMQTETNEIIMNDFCAEKLYRNVLLLAVLC